LYFIEPKWGGDAAQMLAFARECLHGGNWNARVPFILVSAHETLSKYPRGDRKKWLNNADPEWLKIDENWQDIQAVYDGYLKSHPAAYADRSHYGKLASWAGKWQIANEQFEKLGDFPRWTEFGSRDQYRQMKAEAARKSKEGGELKR